jgi:hypothetical protein
VVASCATSACGSGATTIALNKPSVSSPQPVPSGVAAIPTSIATNPSVIVADARNDTLSIVSFNGTSLTKSSLTSLASGCQPANIAIGPVSGGTAAVYVACPGTGAVEVGTVSGSGTPTLGSFTATSLPTTGSNTPSPYGVAVNAAGTDLAVTDSANDDTIFYPSLSGTTLGPSFVATVGSVPDGVGMDGSHAFIANEGSNSLTVIDPATSSGSPGHHVPSKGRQRSAPSSRSPLVAPVRTR